MDIEPNYRVTFLDRAGRRRLPNRRLFMNKLLAVVAAWTLVPSPARVVIHRWRGVRFRDPRRVFIGENVTLDIVFPHNITIGRDVMLTSGTMIIAHYYQASFEGHVFREGRVSIGDGVFLGARSMVVADIEVGDRSVVAAGAVVTRDVNSGAIVAGIPAKEVGKREGRSPDNELPTLTDYLRNRHR